MAKVYWVVKEAKAYYVTDGIWQSPSVTTRKEARKIMMAACWGEGIS